MKPLYGKDALVPRKKRIVFLGDSITDEGTFIAYMDAYFLQHLPEHDITLINLGVSSETISGLSEPDHPFPRPCLHDRIDNALLESRPDWVVLCYGMNDGIYNPFSVDRLLAYQEGMMLAVDKIKAAGAKAIVMTPPPFDAASFTGGQLLDAGHSNYSYLNPYRDYEEVMKRYSDWVLSLEGEVDALVSIHDTMLYQWGKEREKSPSYMTGDGIHPNGAGHWLIAKTLLRVLFNISLEQTPAYVLMPDEFPLYRLAWSRHRLLSAAWREHVGHTNPGKVEALSLEVACKEGDAMANEIRELAASAQNKHDIRWSDWKGYRRVDFMLEGREGFIVYPKAFADEKPWIWRAEFFDAFPYADMALLEQGWAIAYYGISDMYGCPGAVERMYHFQNYVTDAYGLANRTVLFGFSRGGLYSFHYAAAYPERVSVLYLDAPVLDILSWPGGKGDGAGSAQEWEDCLAVYGLTEDSANSANCSPIHKVEEVAAANIPIIMVAGDSDEPVPIKENALILEERYRSLGGNIEMILKPGVGHHPHSLEQPEPIVSFILKHYA